jgi:hypothetical protein
MRRYALHPADLDELALSLLRDGGRTVMYGGDPYEDEVERVGPAPAGPTPVEPQPRAAAT